MSGFASFLIFVVIPVQPIFGEDRFEFVQEQTNHCDPTSRCTNIASIIFEVGASANSACNPECTGIDIHEGQRQINTCLLSSDCLNDAEHILGGNGGETDGSLLLREDTNQDNNCAASTCTNTDSLKSVVNGLDSKLVHLVDQQNNCYSGSECANQASVESTVGTDETVEKKITQKNLCFGNSRCQNDATGSSTDQLNTCLHGSSCSNTGVDNTNICLHAKCDNTGTNSKIISVQDPCRNSGTDTKVICTNGRIITRPS